MKANIDRLRQAIYAFHASRNATTTASSQASINELLGENNDDEAWLRPLLTQRSAKKNFLHEKWGISLPTRVNQTHFGSTMLTLDEYVSLETDENFFSIFGLDDEYQDAAAMEQDEEVGCLFNNSIISYSYFHLKRPRTKMQQLAVMSNPTRPQSHSEQSAPCDRKGRSGG